MAPSNICILGDYTFRFLDLAHAALWIAHKQNYVSKRLVVSSGRGVASALFEYVDKRHGRYATGADDQVTIAQLMSDTYELLATDPRDKLYATLGLRDWPNGVPELLAPDYSKAEANVFCNAARFSLQTPDEDGPAGLESLNTHDKDLRSDRFVSWVIFPSRGYDPVPEPEILQGHLFNCGDNEKQPWPSGQSTSDMDPEVLNVAGISLGRVESVSSPLTRAIASEVQALNRWLTRTLVVLQESNLDEAGAIAAVLIAGANTDKEVAAQEDCGSLNDFQSSVQHMGRIPAALGQPGPSAGDHSAQQDCNFRASRYFSDFQRACVNRVVFRTKNNYVGVGSNLLREGDTAAVIYGADLPFALRLNGQNQYQILAPCYVHGIMFGEAVKRHRERGEKDFLFRIGSVDCRRYVKQSLFAVTADVFSNALSPSSRQLEQQTHEASAQFL